MKKQLNPQQEHIIKKYVLKSEDKPKFYEFAVTQEYKNLKTIKDFEGIDFIIAQRLEFYFINRRDGNE